MLFRSSGTEFDDVTVGISTRSPVGALEPFNSLLLGSEDVAALVVRFVSFPPFCGSVTSRKSSGRSPSASLRSHSAMSSMFDPGPSLDAEFGLLSLFSAAAAEAPFVDCSDSAIFVCDSDFFT